MYNSKTDIITYLDGYMGVTQKIKREIENISNSFVYIGFLLKEVKQYEYYLEGGYSDVYDYAYQELGFKKSSVCNFIKVSETFGGDSSKGECLMALSSKYRGYNYSQLSEMLSLSDKKRALVSSDMTVKQIRLLKKVDLVVQTSGQSDAYFNDILKCLDFIEPIFLSSFSQNDYNYLMKIYNRISNLLNINVNKVV